MNVIFPGKTEVTQYFFHVVWPVGYKQMKSNFILTKQSPLGNPRACGILNC